jgi:hypothetical protein
VSHNFRQAFSQEKAYIADLGYLTCPASALNEDSGGLSFGKVHAEHISHQVMSSEEMLRSGQQTLSIAKGRAWFLTSAD